MSVFSLDNSFLVVVSLDQVIGSRAVEHLELSINNLLYASYVWEGRRKQIEIYEIEFLKSFHTSIGFYLWQGKDGVVLIGLLPS